jgi:enoyl-CoA hydratase/carnithine racemase
VTVEAVAVSADDGRVRTITLNRPERLNAFTAESYRTLARLLRAADEDRVVRAVVLTGAGRAFSSGVDLDAVGVGEEARRELGHTFGGLLEALMTLGKPLIAAVHGVAVGFGATILLHCDVVLVAEDARVRFPFTTLGTAPEAGSSVLLPLRVGPQHAAEVLYTSRWLSAAEAVSMGLATRSHPAAQLLEEARKIARLMAEQPPEAVAAAKRLIRSGQRDAVRAALGREQEEARHLSQVLGPLGRRPPGPAGGG